MVCNTCTFIKETMITHECKVMANSNYKSFNCVVVSYPEKPQLRKIKQNLKTHKDW